MITLVLAIVAGALVVDILVELWRDAVDDTRRRNLERDAEEMRRHLERRMGRRP